MVVCSTDNKHREVLIYIEHFASAAFSVINESRRDDGTKRRSLSLRVEVDVCNLFPTILRQCHLIRIEVSLQFHSC